jgi:hypothetical protein
MCERLVGPDVLKLLAPAAAERPAGGGQHERAHRLGGAALEALEDGRVLAVDRQEQAAPAPLRLPGEVAGRDEALLVRERERDAVLECPERRVDAGEAYDRIQDDIRPGHLEQRNRVAADLHVLDAEPGRERVERRRAGRERDESQVGVRPHDLDGLAADRARRAEQGDPSHRASEVYDPASSPARQPRRPCSTSPGERPPATCSAIASATASFVGGSIPYVAAIDSTDSAAHSSYAPW